MTRPVALIVAEAILAGSPEVTCIGLGVKRSSLHYIAAAAGMPRKTPFARPITYEVTEESRLWAAAILAACRTKEQTREIRKAAQRKHQQATKGSPVRILAIREPTAAALRAACVAVSAMVAEGIGDIDPVTHKLDRLALAHAAKQHGLVLVDVVACRWALRGAR